MGVGVYKVALAALLLFGAPGLTFATTLKDTDQLDAADREEFNLHLGRATACGKARDFPCAAKELAEARKFANGLDDIAALKSTATHIEVARQLAVQDDAARKYSAQRDAVEQNAADNAAQLAENRRAAAAQTERDDWEMRRQDQSATEAASQASAEFNASLAAQIHGRADEESARLSRIEREKTVVTREAGRAQLDRPQERAVNPKMPAPPTSEPVVPRARKVEPGSVPKAPEPVAKAPPIEWGDVLPEALTACRQSSKSGKWRCSGPAQDTLMYDTPTLAEGLEGQYCTGGTLAAGNAIIEGVQFDIYRCGHSLGYGDYDITKHHPEIMTARRQYRCDKKHEPGDGRCATIYHE